MRWQRDELLLALHLYERIPFGQQHSRDPQIIALAGRLGRTPGSVAMKLNNFTSLDPDEIRRGVKGLAGASRLDREVWAEFQQDPRAVERAEELWSSHEAPELVLASEPPLWFGPTDTEATRRVRLAQRYFRRLVLANFQDRCALTDIGTPELLVASHIAPWSADPHQRIRAANGLCLNRLHDAAFDRHLISFDSEQRLLVSPRLRADLPDSPLAQALLRTEGARLRAPVRRELDPLLLARHRQRFEEAQAGRWG